MWRLLAQYKKTDLFFNILRKPPELKENNEIDMKKLVSDKVKTHHYNHIELQTMFLKSFYFRRLLFSHFLALSSAGFDF